MTNSPYILHLDRNFTHSEFGRLASLARWGEPGDFTRELLEGHFAAVSFAAYVRNSEGELVGYVSALANGLHAVFVDNLLTHPEFDREIIGGLLLQAVLKRFEGTPVYGMPFVDEQELFRNQGFKVYRREMVALANRNEAIGAAASTH